MKNLRLLLFCPWLVLLAGLPAAAQPKKVSSLLWEVSGKDLPKPSYLLGTFHLIGSQFVDSLPIIGQKLAASEVMVGELVMDAVATQQVMTLAMSRDTTLNQLLTPADYQRVAAYLREVSPLDLAMFNGFKPAMLSTLLAVLEWQKMNPNQSLTDGGMDTYLQTKAKGAGKEVRGLETVEEQAAVLFDGQSLRRQAEMLVQQVNERDKNQTEMRQMTACYRAQQLDCLQQLLTETSGYSPAEMARLLDRRNANWLQKMPGLMRAKPTFFAVGAGHLVGEKGLLAQLRQMGYVVTPVKL